MKLDALIRKLDGIGSSSMLDGVKRRAAVDGLKLVAQSFRTTTDPYGTPWAGLVRPRAGGPVEDRSGVMKNSALAGPTPNGVRFYFAADYAGFQHWGTVKNPARRLLPVSWLGLPQAWKDMVTKAFSSSMREAMRA